MTSQSNTEDSPAPDGASTATAQSSSANQNERTFFGHPFGLANLSGVEMWERFSFYGLQALLAYYLYYTVADGGLGWKSPPPSLSSVPTVAWCT